MFTSPREQSEAACSHTPSLAFTGDPTQHPKPGGCHRTWSSPEASSYRETLVSQTPVLSLRPFSPGIGEALRLGAQT